MARDAFGRPALWVGDWEIVWRGQWLWWPGFAFYRIPRDNPLREVWRWECYLGPIWIRGWVPRDAPSAPGKETPRG